MLPRRPRPKLTAGVLQPVRRARTSEHVDEAGNYSGPVGLVAGSEPCPVITVEVLVQENVVLPVGICVKLLGAAVDGMLTARVANKVTS